MNFEAMGWAHYAPETAPDPDPTCSRVALVHREHCIVWTPNGEVTATISGHLRHLDQDLPCVGDWVILREGTVISQVLPRRTTLSRREPGKRLRQQVLAANMDLLFIVSGLDRDYNPRRLERYLVLAHESGARPIAALDFSPDGKSILLALGDTSTELWLLPFPPGAGAPPQPVVRQQIHRKSGDRSSCLRAPTP